jgi:hypothetical protein
MKVLIVKEECHGFIFVADSLDAVKRELLRSNWVNSGCPCWDEAKDDWNCLEDIYGENWKEVYMSFDEEGLENMGFYIQEVEVRT